MVQATVATDTQEAPPAQDHHIALGSVVDPAQPHLQCQHVLVHLTAALGLTLAALSGVLQKTESSAFQHFPSRILPLGLTVGFQYLARTARAWSLPWR